MTYTPLFTDHSRVWRDNRYVYPVISRRSRGLSIGVNLNPDKVCNFDCIYCCVDRTTMPGRVEVDLDALRSELQQMIRLASGGEIFSAPPFDRTPAPLKRVNDVAFSGDGEPTSYPRFEEACQIVAGELARHDWPEPVKIVVITNATLLHQPRLAGALDLLDRSNGELWCKLDAGTEPYYQLVERTSVPFARVLDNIARTGRIRPVVIQTLFMRINGQAPPESEIDAYISRLNDLKSQGAQIKLVQVYTIARATAEAYVAHLDRHEVDAIVARVERETGLRAEAFYGPD